MSDEIDDFIRRAAERRRQQGQGPRRAARPQSESAPPPSPPPRPRKRLAPSEVVEAEIIAAEVVDELAGSVHQQLDTHKFDQRAAHLGEQTALADDKLEARLQQTFDHQLGRLQQSGAAGPLAPSARSATDAAATVTSAAANEMLTFLVTALNSPKQVRQAIILSDILTRPEHRW